MSRSRKLPIVKDRGMMTQEYWGPIRREWKQVLKTNYWNEDLHLRNPKVIINDYTYCDWRCNYWYDNSNRQWWLNGVNIEDSNYLITLTRK